MKIAYVSVYDPQRVEQWSGSNYYIARALQRQGIDLTYIAPLSDRWAWFFKIKKLLYRLAGMNYLRDRQPLVLKSYAAQVKKALKGMNVDLVFSPGTREISALKDLQPRLPVAFWTDASFAGMVDFYPDFTDLCAESLRHGYALEQAALDTCRLALYSSQWARETTLSHYQVDPGKVHIVPLGANIDDEPALEEVRGFLSQRPTGVCRLLFNGVAWQRKGGPLAVRVAEELVRQGVPVEMSIVGCQPPQPLPDFVRVYGFISKHTSAGRDLLRRLFSEAHFLLLPTRAECYGIVLSEACAYGVPCVATAVGGIPSVIREGVNGFMLPLSAPAEDYAALIQNVFADPRRYQEMALAAHREYQERLNWRVAGQKAVQLFKEILSRPDTH